MAIQSFELDYRDLNQITRLRNSQRGIRILEETGRLRPYMLKRRNLDDKEFIAWDGEGYTDSQGIHHYMLFMNSKGQYINDPELDTQTIFNFMLQAKRENPKAINIIYGGNYDATMILKDMIFNSGNRFPERLYETLLDTNRVEWYCPPSRHHSSNYYKIEYIPFKWFSVTGRDEKSGKSTTIKIFDIMTFFQMSAIKAWESRGIPVPEVIKTGKAARGGFTWDDLEEVRQYCMMELENYVLLAEQLRREFTEAGIRVTQWHGPGAVANAIFKQYGVNDHMQEPPNKLIERACQHAYFGGRFEQFKAGHYDGKVYVYDINSAYPHQIQNLPSLNGAEWVYTETYDPDALGVWLCSYDRGTVDYLSPNPLPWRAKNGSVGFPSHNHRVWVWHHEAKHATQVHSGYKLIIHDHTKPFAFVPEMYDQRRIWKAEKRGGEKALKLGLNSLYGKLAQRIGGRGGKRPTWHQLAWAGMITSGARAQIWEAISQAPDKIIAVETDSVASMVPLNLDVGEGLGQWELVEYDSMTYVQSGIYFADDNTAATNKARTRGIDVSEITHQKVLEYMRSLNKKNFAADQEGLLIGSKTFVGITSRRLDSYGLWEDSTKLLKVAGGKREHLDRFCAACQRKPRSRHTMADEMHDLSSAVLWGIAPSYRHTLPWLDEVVVPDVEMLPLDTGAVQEFDVPRRMDNVTG